MKAKKLVYGVGLNNADYAVRNWFKRKLELAKELAAIQEDPRVAKALVDRYT